MIGSRNVESEKEQATLISRTETMRYCKCVERDRKHVKEVFSDGSNRLECSGCGQVKFEIMVWRR